MKKRNDWLLPPFVVFLLLLASGLACGGRAEQGQSSAPPVVRFLSPPAGTQVAVGNQVFFQARAFARSGVARVEFSVNGSSVGSQSLSGDQRLYVATQAWTPSAAGTYTLAATAYDTGGQASSPSQVTITVQETFASPGGPPSGAASGGQPASGGSGGQSSGGDSGGQQSGGDSGGGSGGGDQGGGNQGGGNQGGGDQGGGAEPVVDFRADRTQVQAGESTILRWDVENVREVYLDGQPVTGHETREVWPFPPAQTYILHVVLLTGEGQDYGVTIEVQGEIQLVSGPDLAVLAVDAPDRESDESVPFQAEVLNAGDEAAEVAQWRWSINRSGSGPSTWNEGGQFNLEVGQTILLQGEAPPQPQGHWTVYVEVRVGDDENPSNDGGTDDFDSVNPGGGPPQVVPDPPWAPVLCSARAFSSTEVYIEWGEQGMAPGQDGFRIYLAVTELIDEIPIPNYFGHTVRGLEPNTQYHFDVRAYNAGGESPADACAVDVTTLP